MDLKLFLKIRENALKRTRVSTETSRLGRFFFFLSFPIVGYFFRFFFLFFSFRFLAPSVFFFLPSRNNPGGVLRFDFFFRCCCCCFFFLISFFFPFFLWENSVEQADRERIFVSACGRSFWFLFMLSRR